MLLINIHRLSCAERLRCEFGLYKITDSCQPGGVVSAGLLFVLIREPSHKIAANLLVTTTTWPCLVTLLQFIVILALSNYTCLFGFNGHYVLHSNSAVTHVQPMLHTICTFQALNCFCCTGNTHGGIQTQHRLPVDFFMFR